METNYYHDNNVDFERIGEDNKEYFESLTGCVRCAIIIIFGMIVAFGILLL